MCQIDDAFIRKWHPKYDETEGDDPDYSKLVREVAREIGPDRAGTISKDTFLAIWKWKGAIRVKRHLKMEQYDTLYAPAFKRAASKPPGQMLAEILAPGVKLPGVGAPSGSTVIHFMHPKSMPIIDVRTVEVLFKACLVSTKQRDLQHYDEFRLAIQEIGRRCPGWSLREIDRALFAYHKQVLNKNAKGTRCCPD